MGHFVVVNQSQCFVVFLVKGQPKEAIVDKTVDGRTYGLTTDKDLLEKLTLEHFHTQVS